MPHVRRRMLVRLDAPPANVESTARAALGVTGGDGRELTAPLNAAPGTGQLVITVAPDGAGAVLMAEAVTDFEVPFFGWAINPLVATALKRDARHAVATIEAALAGSEPPPPKVAGGPPRASASIARRPRCCRPPRPRPRSRVRRRPLRPELRASSPTRSTRPTPASGRVGDLAGRGARVAGGHRALRSRRPAPHDPHLRRRRLRHQPGVGVRSQPRHVDGVADPDPRLRQLHLHRRRDRRRRRGARRCARLLDRDARSRGRVRVLVRGAHPADRRPGPPGVAGVVRVERPRAADDPPARARAHGNPSLPRARRDAHHPRSAARGARPDLRPPLPASSRPSPCSPTSSTRRRRN